jgi:hypothetical protein
MAQSCATCPDLRAQVNHLQQIVSQQQAQIEFLRRQLVEFIGAVRGTVGFIEAEQDTPSAPPRTVVAAVHTRLTFALDRAEGRN